MAELASGGVVPAPVFIWDPTCELRQQRRVRYVLLPGPYGIENGAEAHLVLQQRWRARIYTPLGTSEQFEWRDVPEVNGE